MIGVISYQTGNASSVLRALQHLDVAASLVTSPAQAAGMDALVLPGVGAADVAMTSLRETGWITVLEDQVLGGGKPFLGVCVGLQLLFEHSEENHVDCLGWLRGHVQAFDSARVRVPQMGWNKVDFQHAHPLTATIDSGDFYYFVNSYFAAPTDPSVTIGYSHYEQHVTAIAAWANVMGTQFHIEKSGPGGLALLRRFASLKRDDLC